MLRLVADENFKGTIVRGLLRRQADLDIVRIQDVGLLGADDLTILDWASIEDRIVLSHDRATLPDFAYKRVRLGLRMPGVFVSSNRLPTSRVIEEILLLANGSEPSEWEGIVLYLPL